MIDRPEQHRDAVTPHWDSRLVESLYRLLYDVRPEDEQLDRELDSLVGRYGEVVYSS